MPEELKSPVNEYEFDPMAAGGIAISLLATYENRRYDPYYVEFEKQGQLISAKLMFSPDGKIYPNPASDVLNINCEEPATLLLTDVSGHTVYTQKLDIRLNRIDISILKRGMYYCANKSKSEKLYTNKK